MIFYFSRFRLLWRCICRGYFLSVYLLYLLSCSPQNRFEVSANDPVTCLQGTVKFAIGDGILQPLCGCQEPEKSNQVHSDFTCTLNAPATVHIQFLPSESLHRFEQVSPDPAPIAPSPIVDSSDLTGSFVHTFELDTPGSYFFKDGFHQEMSLTLVVK